MHEIERNRSQKLGCQANGGVRAGRAPLDPPMQCDLWVLTPPDMGPGTHSQVPHPLTGNPSLPPSYARKPKTQHCISQEIDPKVSVNVHCIRHALIGLFWSLSRSKTHSQCRIHSRFKRFKMPAEISRVLS